MESENRGSRRQDSIAKGKLFPFRVNARRYLFVVGLFTLAGVLGGYAYFYFIGCRTGSCAITSNPYMSMAWGGILGYLVPDFFFRKEEGTEREHEQEGE